MSIKTNKPLLGESWRKLAQKNQKTEKHDFLHSFVWKIGLGRFVFSTTVLEAQSLPWMKLNLGGYIRPNHGVFVCLFVFMDALPKEGEWVSQLGILPHVRGWRW